MPDRGNIQPPSRIAPRLGIGTWIRRRALALVGAGNIVHLAPAMCGRIRVPEDYSEIKIDLRLHEIVPHVYEPRWNVPPTSMLPVVRSKDGKRILEPMRWGLIPSWAKDAKVGFSTINARADSVDSKPAFRRAWETGKRCLIVTDGFYEWRKADKQPFAVALGNRGPMFMAGLYDNWKSPDGWIRSCTVITTDANELVASVHD